APCGRNPTDGLLWRIKATQLPALSGGVVESPSYLAPESRTPQSVAARMRAAKFINSSNAYRVRRILPASGIIGLLSLIVVMPMLMMAYVSSVTEPPGVSLFRGSLTGEWYRSLLRGPVLEAARNSLVLASAGTALALVLGTTFA